jgi:two-component system response regulator CpxR
MKNILVIGDRSLSKYFEQHLGPKGFTVEMAPDAEQGIALAGTKSHALVVLAADRDVLRRIRAASMVPVVVVLPDFDPEACISCLELGADDCLFHPVNPRELVARVRAIQRRAGRGWPDGDELTGELLTAGDLKLETGSRTAWRAGAPLPLTGVEFTLLEILVRGAGRVLSRELLTRQVLGRRFSPFDRAIDVHVSSLRRKLGADGQERVKTVRGQGYLFASSRAEG